MSVDRYEKFQGKRPRRLRHLLAIIISKNTAFAVQTYRALYGVTTRNFSYAMIPMQDSVNFLFAIAVKCDEMSKIF